MNYVEDYRAYLELRRVADWTRIKFTSYVKYLLDYEPDPKKITLKTLSELIKKRRWNTPAAKLFITSASSFLGYLKEQGVISINAAENLKIRWKEKQKKYIVLNDEEMRRVLELAERNMPLREYILIRLFIETGARRNEVLNIMLENIDSAGGKILLETTKGSKPRTVYIGGKTADLIGQYAKGMLSGRLFTCGYAEVGRAVKTAIQIAFPLDIEKHKMTPHSLRHSFVTSFIANGGNTIALKHILGWTSLDMLKTYEHLQDNTIQAEYEKIAQRRAM
ncbi:MAG: tyrosine-type recombinase/integrase [Patescibacteria group bacterium]|jgi:integrase